MTAGATALADRSLFGAAPDDEDAAVSRNLNGQRLGKKGRVTRERIIASAAELVARGEGGSISLSAVARNASIGMTSVYLYFSDLSEVLLAVLEPVMVASEEGYLARLRKRWPDEALAEECYGFVQAYHAFWLQHAAILHLRNSMADRNDERMMHQRISATQPIIHLVVEQMDGDPQNNDAPANAMASMLMTGIERAATVSTDNAYSKALVPGGMAFKPARFLMPGARLLELGIRDCRNMARQSA